MDQNFKKFLKSDKFRDLKLNKDQQKWMGRIKYSLKKEIGDQDIYNFFSSKLFQVMSFESSQIKYFITLKQTLSEEFNSFLILIKNEDKDEKLKALDVTELLEKKSRKGKMVSENLIRSVFCSLIDDYCNIDKCEVDYQSLTVKRDWSTLNIYAKKEHNMLDIEFKKDQYFDEKKRPSPRILLSKVNSLKNMDQMSDEDIFQKSIDNSTFNSDLIFYYYQSKIVFFHPDHKTWFLIDDYSVQNSCRTCDGTTESSIKIYEEATLEDLIDYAFDSNMRDYLFL